MLLLLPIRAEGNNERALTKVLGLLLHKFLFTLGEAAELEDEAAGRGTLAAINMTADHTAMATATTATTTATTARATA